MAGNFLVSFSPFFSLFFASLGGLLFLRLYDMILFLSLSSSLRVLFIPCCAMLCVSCIHFTIYTYRKVQVAA
ncbi:hypothetical protein EV426DRAFT_618395 [Tirmania nivea]|nr:hypothetical protein EV426DRAFT_618395 [Tirmania nivea]